MSSDFISDMEVTDHNIETTIHNIENKIENLRLQECPLKNSSFWKLVISLGTYMKWRRDTNFRINLYKDLIFLENVRPTDSSV